VSERALKSLLQEKFEERHAKRPKPKAEDELNTEAKDY